MDFDTKEIRKMEIKTRKPKKKSSPVATFFIVILIILNLSLMGYIAYDKGLFSDVISYFNKTSKNEKKVAEEHLSLTDEEVSTIYSYLVPMKEKFVTTSSVYKEDLSNDEIKGIALPLLKEEDFMLNTESEDKAFYQLKTVFLEDAVERILGEDVSVVKEDMKTPYYLKYSKNLEGNMTLTYDEVCDCYAVSLEEKEEKAVEEFYTKLASATKKEKKLVLEEKVVYLVEEDDKVKIYQDLEHSHLLKEMTKDEWEKEEFAIDEYLTEASSVIYTFEKSGGSYQFISSELKEKN